MLKSFVLALSALVLSVVCAPQSAIAGPILTQEFVAEDNAGNVFTVGSISFDVSKLDEFFPGNGELLEWQSFTLFGLEVDPSFFYVSLAFNPNDIFAGLEFFSFDVSDVSLSYAFQGFYDLFDQGLSPLLAVTDFATGDYIEFSGFMPGRTSVVSAPASAGLFVMALAGLLFRRRVQKK